jgi:hypothetical protein
MSYATFLGKPSLHQFEEKQVFTSIHPDLSNGAKFG